MSRRVHRAPLALYSDGSLLLNLAEFDGARSPAALLERALEQEGAVFIGVQLSSAEVQRVLARLDDSYAEAAAYLAGGRQRKGGRQES